MLLDLVFPPRCGGCRQPGSLWCRRCDESVRPVPLQSLGPAWLVAAGVLAGPWQEAIHNFKYRPRPQLAGVLADRLAGALRAAPVDIEALSFIPLHPRRLASRGFNQAERLAREVGRRARLPVLGGLERLRDTPAQVGLEAADRRLNVAGAFHWRGEPPQRARLGLVDDVCTTGSTLEAAIEAIGAAGGQVAAGLVLALAGPQTLGRRSVTPAR